MSMLSGIYDSNRIQPVARIKENLSILTKGIWQHYRVDYIEPIPPGPAGIWDAVTAVPTTITTLAANGIIQKKVVNVLQLNDGEFLHLRWEPLDNVEGIVWQLAAQLKFTSRSITSRVSRLTRQYDPTLATTTFFILGRDLDMNLEVRNPMAYATPVARFIFFGNRMILTQHDFKNLLPAERQKLAQGDVDEVRRQIGATTWLPVEGKAS